VLVLGLFYGMTIGILMDAWLRSMDTEPFMMLEVMWILESLLSLFKMEIGSGLVLALMLGICLDIGNLLFLGGGWFGSLKLFLNMLFVYG
jgi:hypothetical protein